MNSFLNACGMRRSLRIEVENRLTHRIEVRLLDQPFAVIGRDPSCDIVLGDKQVSRKHVYLQAVCGQLFWVDLESQLGTFVDGHSWKSGWLGNGRTIAIGPNNIRLADEDEQATSQAISDMPQGSPLVWRAYGDEPLTDATVEFLNGPSESKTWPIRRVLSLIGTARRCKFRLADRSIEPFHCSILRTSQGLFVIDLVGDGVQINDVPVRSGRVEDGDMLQVGRYQICVHINRRNASSESAIEAAGFHQSGTIVPIHQSDQAIEAAPIIPLPAMLPTPRAELMGYETGTIYPAPVERNDLTETVLVPLVSQFGMMQQQMFDQFQQTMNMMVQMFGKMHESQMEMIRQEFGRLNDLSTEISELKAELNKITRQRAEAKANPVPPVSTSMPTSAPSTHPVVPNVASGPRTESRPTTIPRTGALPPLKPRGGAPGQQPPPSAEEASTANQQPNAESGPESIPQNDQEVIFWLHQRITHIQTEREGRWQKLLKLIPGAS